MREILLQSWFWKKVMLTASIMNVCFMWPQIWEIWRTKKTDGVSMPSLFLLLFVQGSFATQGYCVQDPFFTVSGALSACSTIATIASVLHLRNRRTSGL